MKQVSRHSKILLITGLTVMGNAAALNVAGSVEGGASADTRIAGFVVTPFGQPVQEIVSAPVQGGKFKLEIPDPAPISKAQTKLTPSNVSWPGVLDPVSVSSEVQSTELKFFIYRDQNSNGQRDDNEALREVTPNIGKANLFIAWVSGDVTVKANKGYQATLKKGWNAFIVDVGKAVKVQPFDEATIVSVRMGR